MESALKIVAVAVLTSTVCLVLKRTNPEIGTGVALLFCAAAFAAAFTLLSPVLELLGEAKRISGMSEALYYPLFKCLGIAVASKLGADLCRDSGQSAMAGAVEFAGAAAAVCVSMPLLSSLLKMMERLL